VNSTILNPDDFLGQPRVWTPERNAQAWETIYHILVSNFSQQGPAARLYIVCGVQGAGKSTWIRNHAAFFAPSSCIIDAALPGVRHRERALMLAREHAVPAHAVWIDIALDVALQRNLSRAADQQVPEAALRNVHAIFEAPTVDEGFDHIHRVDATATSAGTPRPPTG
jgi:ABC-type thiamine transport system ATPase subunit